MSEWVTIGVWFYKRQVFKKIYHVIKKHNFCIINANISKDVSLANLKWYLIKIMKEFEYWYYDYENCSEVEKALIT